MHILDEHFPKLSNAVVGLAGHRLTLAGGVAIAGAWIATGAVSGFPTWWYLYANIIGTLVTVLILLLVQHSQNREMRAMQIKVDELIRSGGAGNHMIGIEHRETGVSGKTGD